MYNIAITSTRDRIDELNEDKQITKKRGRGRRLGSFLRPRFIYLYGYGIQIPKVIYKKEITVRTSILTVISVDNVIIYNYNASVPRSPVRILMASYTSYTKILPSPYSPVLIWSIT